MTFQSLNFAGRVVSIGSLGDVISDISLPFVTLMSSSCAAETAEALSIVSLLVTLGCKEFCCIGSEAERLHDSIDGLMEDVDELDLVTTWHENPVEGGEYFLFAAGAQQYSLFAMLPSYIDLIDVLTAASEL